MRPRPHRRRGERRVHRFPPGQAVVGRFIQSFKEYPPSQRPGSFSVGQAMDSLQAGAAGGGK